MGHGTLLDSLRLGFLGRDLSRPGALYTLLAQVDMEGTQPVQGQPPGHPESHSENFSLFRFPWPGEAGEL